MGVITEIKVFIVCYLALLDLSPSLAQRVTMPPGMSARLTLSPSNRTVKKFIGDTYVISCLNGSADTEWLTPQNEKVNTTKLGRMRQQPRRGGGGIDLFLTRIMADDAGMYSCRSKSTTISFNLIVVKPIAFDNSLAFQTAVEGSTYTVRCVAHGQSNTPKLYWKVDQKSPQGPKYKVVKDGLIVHNVTREDAKKNYVCHAMDIDSPMPDSKLMTITLSVTRKPTSMSSGNINATFAWAVLGEWASLACKMDAEPIPTFEWFSPTNEKLTFTDETSIVNDINDSEYTSTLQIIVSKDSKFGNYTCRARNDMGVTDQVFILQKGNKPATPFLEIDAVGPAEAKIRVQQFKAPPGTTLSTEIDLPITDFVVEHKLATDTIWFPGKYKPYEQGFVLQGLQPATTYHVRTALKNVASTGTFSPPIQVGTADPVPQISSTAAAATTTLTAVQSTASTAENITEGEHQCSEDQFKCKTQRYCVPLRWKCDGEPDCSDSSDEDKEMCRPTAAEATIEKLMSQVSPAVSAALPLFASPSSRLLFITRNNQSAKDTNTSGATTSSSSVSPNFVTRNLNTSPNVLQEADSETEEESSEEEEPKTTTTNQTTVTTSNVNNTKITTTTNVVATVVQTVLKQGSVKIITTKKEEIVTERIESNDLK